MKHRLFDSIESVLKSESLNTSQQQKIQLCLAKSKYSSLSYNRSEHDIQVTLTSYTQLINSIKLLEYKRLRVLVSVSEFEAPAATTK